MTTRAEIKRDIILALMAGILSVLFVKLFMGCTPAEESDFRAAKYGTTLEECNRTSTTLCESIACENHARAANGRHPRALPPSCHANDGGGPTTTINSPSTKDGGSNAESR